MSECNPSLIALDDLPFNFVDNVRFQRLMVHMDQVPSAKYFRTQLLPSMYRAVKQQMISGANYVSFTTDTWEHASVHGLPHITYDSLD